MRNANPCGRRTACIASLRKSHGVFREGAKTFHALYVGEHPQQPAGRYGKDGGKRDSADTSALASAVASPESQTGNLESGMSSAEPLMANMRRNVDYMKRTIDSAVNAAATAKTRADNFPITPVLSAEAWRRLSLPTFRKIFDFNFPRLVGRRQNLSVGDNEEPRTLSVARAVGVVENREFRALAGHVREAEVLPVVGMSGFI